MRYLSLSLATMALASLVAAAPAALAEETSDESMPRLVITLVCTVYGDYMDDAVDSLELLLGVNVAEIEPECEMSTEYIEGAALPPAAKEPAVVTIPEGALFPPCADTNACFSPYTITVESGDAVTWVNKDTVLHTVTGETPHPDGNFDNWMLPGKDFTFEFETVGEYPYHCSVHPWARGVVVVEPSALEPSIVVIPEPTPTQPALAGSEAVYEAIDSIIDLYKTEGAAASFETINAMSSNPDQGVVAYVIDAESYMIVAHSTNPLFLGFNVEPLLEKASIPLDTMLEIIERHKDEGVWLSYPVPDPQGNIVNYERGLFKMYDGHVFGARYAVGNDVWVQAVVSEMIRLYNHDPETAFDTISSFMSTDPHYPFVLDPNTDKVVAHGSNPLRVGVTSVVLTNADKTKAVIMEELENNEGTWVEYFFNNPSTGMEESKHSWLVLHDGYIFGSGYY